MEAKFSNSEDQRLYFDKDSSFEHIVLNPNPNKLSRKTNVVKTEHGGNFSKIIREDTIGDSYNRIDHQTYRGNSNTLDYQHNYVKPKIKTKRTKKIKDFSETFPLEMSPIKSLPNATCNDKNCQCYKRHRRETIEEGDVGDNVRNDVCFNINSVIRYSPKNMGSMDNSTNHSFITKERPKTNKIIPFHNSDKSEQYNVKSQKTKNHTEIKNGVYNISVAKTRCDADTKKPPRKTLSLSAWAKIRETERLTHEPKIPSNHTTPYIDINKEIPTAATVDIDNDSNRKGSVVFHDQTKPNKTPSSSFDVKPGIKTKKLENQAHSITCTNKTQQNVSIKMEPDNDSMPSKQISFIRNDIGVPVLFSPQRLTASPSLSREASEKSNGPESKYKFPQPIYSTYGTIPSPSKTLNYFYVLPYLIVPAKTLTAISSQDSRDDSANLMTNPEKATLNKSSNCMGSNQTSQSGDDNNRAMPVLERISPVNNDSTKHAKEKKKIKIAKKCISKPKRQIETCRISTSRRKSTREMNKLKFALSLELMKKEKSEGDETMADNIIESTKTGRITFVPAAQIRTTEADTCYTLQVVSVIKTQVESECRHTLGWTPAAINKTAEGHINMVFAPKVCKGLYLIEDMIRKTGDTRASGRQDVRLIPFAPFLELPKTCLALAIGNQETTWGACVDFLKQLKPFSLVPEVVGCIVEGRDCACSNVSLKQKAPEHSTAKKKSKFVSLRMPSCHCCQCQPKQSRRKATGK